MPTLPNVAPLHLVITIWSLDRGGAERIVLNWLKNLDPELFRITLVTVYGGSLEEEIPAHVELQILQRYCHTIEMLKRFGFRWLGRWWSDAGYLAFRSIRLRQLLEKLQPDLVVTHLPNESVLTMVTKYLGPISPWPIVCWVHNVPHPGFTLLESFLHKLLYPKMDGWVAVSGAAADAFSQRFGVPRELVAIEWNPHDFCEMKSLAKKGEATWPMSNVKILAVGRLVEQKNFSFLLQVADQLREHPGWTLTIVGGGEQYESLSSKVQELDLEGRVTLTGELANPYPYYETADLFLLTSHYEGLPGVIIEAMSFALPIVASRGRGGTAEALDGGNHGVLVEEFCPQLFASIVLSLLQDIEARRIWGQRASEGSKSFALERRISSLEKRLLCYYLNHFGISLPGRTDAPEGTWFLQELVRDGRNRKAWLRSTVTYQLSRLLLNTLRWPLQLISLKKRAKSILDNGNFHVYRATVVNPESKEEFCDKPSQEWKRLKHSLDKIENGRLYKFAHLLLSMLQDPSHLQTLHLGEETSKPAPAPLCSARTSVLNFPVNLVGPPWWKHLMSASVREWRVPEAVSLVAVDREFDASEILTAGRLVLWLLEDYSKPPEGAEPELVYTTCPKTTEKWKAHFTCPVRTLAPCSEVRFDLPWTSRSHRPKTPPAWLFQKEPVCQKLLSGLAPDWRPKAEELLQIRRRVRHRSTEHAINQIADDLGLPPIKDLQPVFVTCSNRPNRLPEWHRQLSLQTVKAKTVLLCHGSGFTDVVDRLKRNSDLDLMILSAAESLNHGECMQRAFEAAYEHGDAIVCLDDDDFYGAHYTSDLLDGLRYSMAALVGKNSFLVQKYTSRYLLSPGTEHVYTPLFAACSLAFRREVLERVSVRPHQRWWDTKFFRDAWNEGLPQLSLDRFNFCYNRGAHNSSATRQFDRILQYASEVRQDGSIGEVCYV